ncbi:MAG: hypothetical protein Salg2KO_17570 [Salibacteraceae bacterium]
MKLRRITTSLTILCLAVATTSAQVTSNQAIQALNLVANKYLDTDQYYARFTVNFFTSHLTKTAADTEILEIYKRGKSVHKRQGDVEDFYTGEHLVNIAHKTQIIRINEIDPDIVPFLLNVNFAALLDMADSLSMRQSSMRAEEWTFHVHDGLVAKIVVKVDKNSNLIEKQTIFYEDPYLNALSKSGEHPRLEIVLEYFDQTSDIRNDLFSLERFASMKNGQYTFKPEFVDYQISSNAALAKNIQP